MSGTGGLVVHVSDEYTIKSFGNGWAYEIVRADGASVWLQDEDAATFSESLKNTGAKWTVADECAEWFNGYNAEVL